MIAPEILLCMCCVVAVCSETCIPAQSEWQVADFGLNAADQHHELFQEFDVVSYDAINNRSAVLAIGQNGKTVFKEKIITIYSSPMKGKQYLLDLITDKCYTIPIVEPFYQVCVPDSATRVGTFTLGFSKALNLTRYEISHANPQHDLSGQEIDSNTIVPVSETIYGKFQDTLTDFVETVAVINFTLGIKNASVFDIPAECKHAEESSFPEHLIRHHHFVMTI